MVRVVYAALIGLLGAGIVHVVMLLILPSYSDRDAWSRLARVGEPGTVVRVDGADGPLGADTVDPSMAAAACRFDLSDGPLRVTAVGAVPFWTASVYDRGGTNRYGITDRGSAGPTFDLIVLTPAQLIEMRKDMPAELAQAAFAEVEATQAMLVVRAFRPDESWTPTLDAFFAGMRCTTLAP